MIVSCTLTLKLISPLANTSQFNSIVTVVVEAVAFFTNHLFTVLHQLSVHLASLHIIELAIIVAAQLLAAVYAIVSLSVLETVNIELKLEQHVRHPGNFGGNEYLYYRKK